MASFAVELRDVGKRFGSVVALDGVDLAIRKGEFFSLLGPSGCGKTTTLNLIGGFETASRGTLLIDGQPMGDTPSHARPVNTVFQSYALFPHMSVADNVGFGLRMKKVSRPERRRAVEEMLHLVSLEGFEERRPGQLSGGQRQRVALARALINHPSVLLLDEPLGALDLKLRKQMQAELTRLQRRVGITFVYVTHDQDEALSMGHIVFTVPFAILIVSARLYGFDRSLERAAGDLGATPARVFWHVTLPLILPGVAGAALFVFTLSMDEFLITFFVSGQKGTLTMYIWSLLKDGIAPRVNALASVLLAASFALLLVGGGLLDRGTQRRRTP